MFVKEAELLKELSEAEEALAKGEDGALERFEELQQKAQDGDALNMEPLARVVQQMGRGGGSRCLGLLFRRLEDADWIS